MLNYKILMGENLVWNSHVKVGSHHYARIFLKAGNSVLWVSLPWSPFHLLKGVKYERIEQWNKGKIRDYGNGLKTYCPLTVMPYRNNFLFRSRFAAENTLKYSFPGFQKILDSTAFADVDMLWLTDPRFWALRKYVKYKYLVYRCVDDLPSFSNVAPSVEDLESEMVEQADIVFATAGSLIERLRKWRKDIVFLPNGVDLNSFVRESYSEPELLKSIAHPRVIYVGTLGHWFDVELIAHTADRLKDINFILIGPVRTNCNSLKNFKNIHLTGPMDFNKIPDFLKYSDAAIIPFAKSKLSDAVNPIKLYEYFSMGLPVVTTDMQEVVNMQSPAIVAKTKDAFVKGINDALQCCKDKPEFFHFAKENSWEARYQIVKKELRKLC